MKPEIIIKNVISKYTPLFRNLNNQWVFQVASKLIIITTSISIALIIIKWTYLPAEIPFWYYQPWGSDRLAPTYIIFLHPIASFLVYILNTVCAALFLSQHRVFSQIILAASIFVACFSLLCVVKIIFLVI